MLTSEELRQISVALDAALEVAKNEPKGLLRHLLSMTKMELEGRLSGPTERCLQVHRANAA